MTVYYVDPASASEASPYDTWAKGAHTLQTILSIPPAATDIIYCRGHEHIAAELDCSSSGTNAGGWIRIIGCGTDGHVDQGVPGDRYVINCDGADINGFDFSGQDMWWLENIEVTNIGAGGKHGFYSSAATSTGHVLINCCANTLTGNGFNMTNLTDSVFIRCVAYACTLRGFLFAAAHCRCLFCCARDNSDDGFASNGAGDLMYGCISHSNTQEGVGGYTARAAGLYNCVINQNKDEGIELGASTSLYAPLIIGCRITTNTDAAIDNTSDEPFIFGWCYSEDNGHAWTPGGTAALQGDIPDTTTYEPTGESQTSSNLSALANAEQGYVNDDDDITAANLATGYVDAGDPDLRRTPIIIPII